MKEKARNAKPIARKQGLVIQELPDEVPGAGYLNTLAPIQSEQYLGIAHEGILAVNAALDGAAVGLLELLVTDEHEIVTIIEGDGATPAATRVITEWLRENRPDVTAEVHHGGQPLYPYLFGIE